LTEILKKTPEKTSVLNLDHNKEFNFEGMVVIDDLRENYLKKANIIEELSISNHPKLIHIDDVKIFQNLMILKAIHNSISIPDL